VAALQLAHRSETEAGLPTKVLHDRACRDRDQAVQKLGRTKSELEDTQAQLEALLKRQEMLQGRAKEQTAKVEACTKKVHGLGQRLAIETAATPGLAPSPFTAAGAGFPVPSTASPFKRQRPDEDDDDGMGRREAPASPLGTRRGATGGGAAASAPRGPPGTVGSAVDSGRPSDADLFASLGGALASTGHMAHAAAAGHTNF
jgi:hypothetical protein